MSTFFFYVVVALIVAVFQVNAQPIGIVSGAVETVDEISKNAGDNVDRTEQFASSVYNAV